MNREMRSWISRQKIQAHTEKLSAQRADKERLLAEKSYEREQLRGEIAEQQKTIQELQGKETEVRNEIAAKQKEVNRLEKEIEKIIADEMRKAREEAERQALIAEAKKLGVETGEGL